MSNIKIALVGESWGSHEAAHNHALVWWSGRELATMLSEAQLAPRPRVRYPSELDMIAHWDWLRREHGIAVTNVFAEHPAGDNTALFFAGPTDGIPVSDAFLPIRIKQRVLRVRTSHAHHVERLWTELESLRPNLLVAMGNFACWALLGTSGITAIRGTPKLSLRLNLKTIPTFHPAALREWRLRPDIVSDLCKARREAEFPEIRRPQRWITAEDPGTNAKITLAEIEAWFDRPPADRYSIDIETGRALFTNAELTNMTPTMRAILADLISMVSFARTPNEAICIPFMTRDDPELNYWPTPADETRAWSIVARELRSPISKIFQNGIFDISHFLRRGMITLNADEDSMILHYALYPELRKSLGYLASRYSNEIAWKQMRTFGESIKRDE